MPINTPRDSAKKRSHGIFRSAWTRGSGQKLDHGRFHLNIGKQFITVQVTGLPERLWGLFVGDLQKPAVLCADYLALGQSM